MGIAADGAYTEDSGVPKELVPISERALSGKRARTFAKYKLVVGAPIVLLNTLLLFGAPIAAGLVALAEIGWVGGLLALPTAAVAMLTVGRTSLLGNLRLRDALAARLGVRPKGMEFVGIAKPESNDPLAMRLETDDNVGFLFLGREELRIFTEDSTIVLSQDELRGFSTERVAALPYLIWIRVEFFQGSEPGAFLMMSREASNISEQRRKTIALRAKLVEWHSAAQLAWHKAHFEKPTVAQPSQTSVLKP